MGCFFNIFELRKGSVCRRHARDFFVAVTPLPLARRIMRGLPQPPQTRLYSKIVESTYRCETQPGSRHQSNWHAVPCRRTIVYFMVFYVFICFAKFVTRSPQKYASILVWRFTATPKLSSRLQSVFHTAPCRRSIRDFMILQVLDFQLKN